MRNFLDGLVRRKRRPRPPRPETVISRHIGKAIGAVIIAAASALLGLNNSTKNKSSSTQVDSDKSTYSDSKYPSHSKSKNIESSKSTTSDQELLQALRSKTNLSFVEIKNAKVYRRLKPDNTGSRHQRWLIKIDSGETIMAVYNIDLAEEIPLHPGDTMNLAGELVFNERKGEPLIHWLHKDPDGQRPNGYVEVNGKTYGL